MANQVVECRACGHIGATAKKGSTFVTLILLLVFFPVGVLYWLMNRSGGGVCSACKSSQVKLYTPKANTHAIEQANSSNVQQIQCPDCREYIRYDARKCKHCGSMVGQL